MTDVSTYHVDSGRSGLNSNFPFAPAGGTWRRYTTLHTNAAVRAAPLFLAGYTFAAGAHAGETHDVVIVAASDNTVYAYAEDQALNGAGGALWTQSLGPASSRGGSNIRPPIGICGTPVIDRANALIFAMALVHDSSGDVFKIFSLDINTGAVLDRATLKDPGAAGRPTFDPTMQDQRGGLNLVNGWVFATFAAFLGFDAGSFHGWIVACKQGDLSQQLFFSDCKNVIGGGIWGPGGIAAAPDGTMYISTGNGGADAAYWTNLPAGKHPGDIGDYFEGVVAVQLTGAPGLKVLNWYQPTWARALNDGDQDFGGSSPIVLPSIGGRRLVVTTAKDGNIYLLDGALPGWGGELWTSHTTGKLFMDESICAPAYFHDAATGDHYVYVIGKGNPGLAAFKVDVSGANPRLASAWNAGVAFDDASGSAFVIADPTTKKALVWVADGQANDGDDKLANCVLRAWDAVSGKLVFSSDAASSNALGICRHFPPITGAGKSVFVGTEDGVACYLNVGPTLSLMIDQNTFGQNEVDIQLPGVANFAAGWVRLDGFRPSDLGLTKSNLGSPPASSIPTFSAPALNPSLPAPVASRIAAMLNTPAFQPPVIPVDPAMPDTPQGFLFPFTVAFKNDDGFQAMRNAAPAIDSTLATLTATLTTGGSSLSDSGQIELTTGENPRFIDIDPVHPTAFPSWLSFDLRVFKVTVPSGGAKTVYGATITSDPAGAPDFIAAALKNFDDAAFDALPQDEATTKLEFLQTDNNGDHVFNFAVARVRLLGKNPGVAKSARVFFRLFQAQNTVSEFNTATTFRRSTGAPFGHIAPLLGVQNDHNGRPEYVTVPCFATKRVNLNVLADMRTQTDPPNVRDLATSPGVQKDYFFGCWLDVNQTSQRFMPKDPPANPSQWDGPWTGLTLHSLQEAILAAPHQCLIAEIAFDETPIPPGANTAKSDKLAQRNLAWIDGPNPGIEASRRMPHPIQFRLTKAGSTNPDELMIFWGATPRGGEAEIYTPSLSAAEILHTADMRYSDHKLRLVDANTLACPTGGVTFVPIPEGASMAAGLLTINLPQGVRKGDAYSIVVRHMTDARAVFFPPAPGVALKKQTRAVQTFAAAPPVIQWRQTAGAFQFNLAISTKAQLLRPEERLLAVLRWMELNMSKAKRWYPVLLRYIDQIAGRVAGFGGDPDGIKPSPTGDIGSPPCPDPHPHHEKKDCEKRITFMGKIIGLIFDQFGDYEGFVLATEDGERKFFGRESEMKELAERVWRDRLRIAVLAEQDEPHRPLTIVVSPPPSRF